MSLHYSSLAIYYRPQMSPPEVIGFSKSPTKPRRFVEFLQGTPVWPYVDLRQLFHPVTREQLLLAHEREYVDAFMSGAGNAESNGLRWSQDFCDSVQYTNGSLIAAVRGACKDPALIRMSPTSGFHHATPGEGGGFCTFSGQVIAALEIYRTEGKVGAWVDLDGHFGNSIEDSRSFAPALRDAIPEGCNINPSGTGRRYLSDLERQLRKLGNRVVACEIDYVCVAHGADSHEWDDLGSQCSTAEWLDASDLVYSSIRSWSCALRRPVPVVLCLFGGYRDDHPESVLGLHAMDAARALGHLAGVESLLTYEAEVAPPAERQATRWR